MARKNIHISLIIAFTALFLIFNIGMPIVLHYCEMMNAYSSSDCNMCHPEKSNNGQLEYSKQQHNCCSSVVLASFNKVEFLQTQKNEVKTIIQQSAPKAHPPLADITPISHTFCNNNFIYNTLKLFSETHSPSAIEDIPIFTSSLLI